ncbi:MAG: hypothetical protein QM692_03980 [Thermomicrobiales bacterium]
MRTSIVCLLRRGARLALVAGALAATPLLVSSPVGPLPAAAQESVAPANMVYAATDLNLRKGPGFDDVIFTTIPYGAALERRDGGLQNDYVPVRYDGIDGWVFALGTVATPQDLPSPGVEPVDNSFVAYSGERVTLSPLLLRSAPSLDADTLAGMPEGSTVYLTEEGYENGYITVEYGGIQGWAYADFLAEPGA